MLTYSEMMAEVVEHFIEHNAHGYSQPNRDGDGTVEELELSDGTLVEFNGGDRDCSRLQQTAGVVVGVLPRGIHMWTGNERYILLANGFVDVDPRYAMRGDIVLRSGHTEMYLGDGWVGGARQSEHGTIDGETGDQTGYEIAKSKYNPSEWTYCFRCTKQRPSIEGEGNEMIAIVHPDAEKTLYYVTDSAIHGIATEQEKLALMDLYKKSHDGKAIPMFKISKPYFDSLKQLYKR